MPSEDPPPRHAPSLARRRAGRALQGLVIAGLLAAAYLGWRELWFLTDDAFITFRYASHHLSGWGYNWNPPPFRHTEGYSNFLWMVILEGVWRVTGVDPPRSCNWVSLGFSYGSLILVFWMVRRLTLPPRLEALRFLWAALVVAATLSNRTFLASMSSGLETGLFVFCVIAWVMSTLEAGRQRAPLVLGLSAVAGSAMALTRPDGWLAVLATMLLAVVAARKDEPRSRSRWLWPAALGVAPAFVHLCWRRWYYGEWVPNTFFAKQGAPWPASGLRYAASFVLEYAVWVWVMLAIGAAVAWARRGARPALDLRLWTRAAVFAVLAAHFLYYTLLVGGDHFEYRVYAHLVPLILVSFVWLLGSIRARPAEAVALFCLGWCLSLPIPWVHYVRNRQSFEWSQASIADSFPVGPIRSYVASFDELQEWLAAHGVCIRHQPHRAFARTLQAMMPLRDLGETVRAAGFPVLLRKSVGVAGWVFPEIAILDELGLNDRVIARAPPPSQTEGRVPVMAHDRAAPPGYLECFEPNVEVGLETVWVNPRKQPLAASKIAACEARFDPLYRGHGAEPSGVDEAPAAAPLILPDLRRLAAAAAEPQMGVLYAVLGSDPEDRAEPLPVGTSPLQSRIAALQTQLAREPENLDAWNDLGVCWARAGRYLDAIGAFEHALARQPSLVSARDNLKRTTVREWLVGPLARARQLLSAGEAGLAVPLLRRKVRLEPENATGHQVLGVALAKTGRYAEAEQSLRRALELQPGFAEAREWLARVTAEQASGAAR